jgi:putative tricarboxylic transport membrane protein
MTIKYFAATAASAACLAAPALAEVDFAGNTIE